MLREEKDSIASECFTIAIFVIPVIILIIIILSVWPVLFILRRIYVGD